MRKAFFFPMIVFAVLMAASCKDDGKGGNPNDYLNDRNKDNNRDDNNRDDKDTRDDRDTRDDDNYRDEGSSSLIGRWSIVDYRTGSGEKMTADELRDMRSSSIEFKRDGSYIARTRQDGETETEYGTYTFNERSGRLVTTDDKNKDEEVLEVEFEGKNRVVVSSNKDLSIIMERD